MKSMKSIPRLMLLIIAFFILNNRHIDCHLKPQENFKYSQSYKGFGPDWFLETYHQNQELVVKI